MHWADFDDAWILYEDEDLIAVDKPVGVPSQAAEAERPDDLVTRLRAHLAARDGRAPYLGVHQRLDKDTSGVLLMTRRQEANVPIAAQFEGRKVDKRYVAGAVGFRQKRAILRDPLASDKGGRMRVTSARDRVAQLAVTHVERTAQHGDRALLMLTLETGRTHQARVQLAHAGAPIAGDRLYGGAPAPRLLLHAASIELIHPSTKVKLRVSAKTPTDFDTWLERGDLGEGIYDDPSALDRALERAFQARFALGRATTGPRATTAFRLVNEAGDALPGLAVDVYGDYLVAQLYGDDGVWREEARRERVLDKLHALGARGIYLKVRPKHASVLDDARREELAPRTPVRGEAAPADLEILEEGIVYGVRLGDGLSTGLFLDQRGNRRRVRELAANKTLLNLFAYTCGFSVAGAVGGATRTLSVDVATLALLRGRANMQRAGLAGEHAFVAEDVFAWMRRAERAGERFDLVVVDPPTFATTKKSRFSVASDYADLAARAMGLVAARGTLLACANHRGVTHARFRLFLHDAARLAKREVQQMKSLPDPADYPSPLNGESHLKSALVTFAD